ncbi:unnamed protein product [Macrosiphum euphorbiae]|uniref:DUF4806 domain-containing protein n=1 Tax=Macrosiphum euphorbiae TaxID=13131 RepID=A0AAV0Y698_9HEMI|nr:unnamed protein product [Macrosiphum euphorbiae]
MTNEVQHVPNTWLSNNVCWFPFIQSDNKKIYFTVSQVANMIKKCTVPNKNDGKNYDVVIRAGPFDKESHAKKVSKAWSGPDDSSSDSNVSLSPEKPSSPKKRKIMPYFSSVQENELIVNLPKAPTTPIRKTSSTKNSIPVSLDLISPLILKDISTSSTVSSSDIRPLNNSTVDICAQSTPNSSSNLIIKDKTNTNCSTAFCSYDPGNFNVVTTINEVGVETNNSCESVMTDSKKIEKNSDVPIEFDINNMDENISSNSVRKELFGHNSNEDEELIKSLDNGSTLTQLILEAQINDDFFMERSTNCDNSSLVENTQNENCCCKNITELKSILKSNNKSVESTLKQLMTQIFILNNSNTRICNAFKTMDQKIQMIMKSNDKTRSLALPIPVLPSSLVGILPTKSIDEVDAVEALLADNEDGLKNQEELKSYLYIKSSNTSTFSAAIRHTIDTCFEYHILALFSYKGKTKRSFIDLKLYSVIYEALSGFRTSPLEEQTFHKVTDNYIRHAFKKDTNTPVSN